jgi:hypothetical protein
VRAAERARRARLAAGAGLSVGAAMGITSSAQALDFTVTNTTDSNPGSLRAEVQAADGNPGPDRILFDSSVTGTITLTSGEIVVNDDLDIAGPGAGALTVSGGNSSRILQGAGAEMNISGLTFTAGRAPGGPGGVGGAILSSDALTVSNTVLTGNSAVGLGSAGGAIASYYGPLTIADSTIVNNSVDGSSSGSIGVNGGAIYAPNVYGLSIQDSTISRNTVTSTDDAAGGAIFAASIPVGTTFSITDSTIADNHLQGADSAVGDGILSGPFGSLRIERSTISGNTETNVPALYGYGGGLYSVASAVTVRNSTIAENQSLTEGGGLDVSNGSLNLTSSTIAGNQSDQGGGLFACFCSSVESTNSILADNTATSGGADVYMTGGTFDAAFTLMQSGVQGGTLVETVAGSNRLGVNPQLGTLTNNGGPTETMALPPSSPAVNQGSGSGTDQRGLTRPVIFPGVPLSAAAGANGADMGAFELQGSAAAAPPSNKFDFGNLKLNTKKGIAYLIIFVPGPGDVGLDGKGVQGIPLNQATISRSVPAGGVVKLKIRPAKGKRGRKLRRALRRKGTASFSVQVTYVPKGGTANTRARKIKLVKHGRR